MPNEDLKLDDKELFGKVPSMRVNGETVLLSTRKQTKKIQEELNGTQESLNEISTREESRYVEQANTNRKVADGISSAQSTANTALQTAKDVAVASTKYTDAEIAKLDKYTKDSFKTVSDQIYTLTNTDEKTISNIEYLKNAVQDAEESNIITQAVINLTKLVEEVRQAGKDAIDKVIQANAIEKQELMNEIEALKASQVTVSVVDGTVAQPDINKQVIVSQNGTTFVAVGADYNF